MTTNSDPQQQVHVTPEAVEAIDRLRAIHGELLFHQSGGCCDGSGPMCYPADDFFVDDNDVLLGHVAGYPFYMSYFLYKHWQRSVLTLDVVPGRGSGFSIETTLGLRFVTRSRVCAM